MALIVGLILIACVIVLIGVAFRISAAILRMSVSITNGILGGRDVDEHDYRRGASAYDPIPRPASLAGIRIPMPGVMYAILINIGAGFASLVAQTGVMTLLAMNAELPNNPTPDELVKFQLLAWAVGVPAGLFGSLVVLKMALPTTFFRAAVVAFVQFVLSMLLVAAIGFGLMLLTGASIDKLPTSAPAVGGNTWFK